MSVSRNLHNVLSELFALLIIVEGGMDNYQDNKNNNERINGRRILIDEEVYDEIGIGGW